MVNSIYSLYLIIASTFLIGAASTYVQTNLDAQRFMLAEECAQKNFHLARSQKEALIAACKEKKIAALEDQYSSIGWLVK